MPQRDVVGFALLIGLPIYVSVSWPADTSFLSYSLAGVFVIHCWSRPRPPELVATGIAALFLLALYIEVQGTPHFSLPTPGFFLGLGSLAVIGGRTVEEGVLPSIALPALLLPATLVITVLARPLWVTREPVWDWTMLAFDGGLGGQLSFLLGRAFARHPWLTTLHQEIYDALPLGMALLYAAHMDSVKALERQRVILLLLLSPLPCLLIYHFMPVVGPKFAFPTLYPTATPALPQSPYPLIPVDPEVLRNGLPSMHLGWALLLWWGLRERSVLWGWASGLFLALTTIATLGLGQHYLVDLIVAVPFVGAMQGALDFGRPWRGARGLLVGLGIVGTAVWILILRDPSLWTPPSMMPLAAVSVALPLWLVLRRRSEAAAR